MAGLVPAIHVLLAARKTWMPAQASLRSLRKLGCERGHDEGDCSVEKGLRVPGFAGEHADVHADLLQRLVVLVVVVPAEDQLGVGGTMQPTVLMDLAFELSRRPAGIAECEHRVGRAVAARVRQMPSSIGSVEFSM